VGTSSVRRNSERGPKKRVLKIQHGGPGAKPPTAGDHVVLRAKPPEAGVLGSEPPAAGGYPMGVWGQSPQPIKKICNFKVKL